MSLSAADAPPLRVPKAGNQSPAARVVRLQPKLVARFETSTEPLELIAILKSVFLRR
jgi:hypothetical protein